MTKIDLLKGVALLAFSALSAPAVAQNADSEVAEMDVITVTGSLIKRTEFRDAGSPIDVVDQEEIKLNAPGGKISDVLRYIPSNYGQFSTGTSGETESFFGGSAINLRGLGAGSTLTLVNGRRQTRIPVAQDGRVDANTLYPSIMIDRIEVLNDGASSIYGTDAVAGVANFLTRDNYDGLLVDLKHRGQTDGYIYKESAFSILGGTEVGSRGHAIAAFEYVKADPLQQSELGFAPLANQAGSANGQPGNFRVPLRDANGALVRNASGAVTLQTRPDPDCENVIGLGPNLNGSVFFNPAGNGGRGQCRLGIAQSLEASRAEERWAAATRYFHNFDNGINFTGELAFARVKTVNRGNTTTPVNIPPIVPGENPGNPFRAVDANGNPLFAADSNSDGVADRDVNGDVILSGSPLDPTSGIAFNEDVVGQFRPIGDVGGPAGAINTAQRNESRLMRITGVLDGPVPGTDSWTWETGYTFSNNELDFRFSDSNRGALIDALNCQGGAGGTECFNPFGSQFLVSSTDPRANTDSVLDSIAYIAHDTYESELWSIDGLLTGDLFEMPAGTVAGAFGAQFRKESLFYDYDGLKSAALLSFSGFGDQDFQVSQDTWAIYGEALIPLMSGPSGDLEVSVAARYEGDDNNDTFNPKISAVYNNDWVTLRGSYSTSFLAPSLFQTAGNVVARQRVSDPITGVVNENVNTTIVGNSDLDPQESAAYNLGFTLTPSNNVRVGADYWAFSFKDVLATPSGVAIINADPNDPRILRDPTTNAILTIQRPFFNASRQEVSGIDFQLGYDHEMGKSKLVFDINGTLVTKYDLRATATSTVIDGIGSENQNNFGTTIPEWKVFGRAGYERGPHGAYVSARWYSEVENEDGILTPAPIFFDFLYSYDWEEKGLSFSAGLLNIGNKVDPIIEENNLFVEQVQDPLGRRFFVGVSKEF